MGNKLEFSAWLRMDHKNSMQSFQDHLKYLARVNPVWSFVDTKGMPVLAPGIARSVVQDVVKRAHDAGVKVFGLNSNYTEEAAGFDADRAHLFLADENIRSKHIDCLIELAKADGMDGLDLDYESMHPEDCELFTAFVKEVSEKLHAEKMELAAAVHAKRSHEGVGPEDWAGPKSQRWRDIAPCIDYFQPMCYDYHNSVTQAGPVAPPEWDGEVLDFALEHTRADKIEMGIPAYGLDWEGMKGDPVDWNKWVELEAAHGPARRDASQELTLSYNHRTVFYNDSVAWLPKLKQAKDRGVRGIAMWVLGAEDPRVWKLVESMNEEA